MIARHIMISKVWRLMETVFWTSRMCNVQCPIAVLAGTTRCVVICKVWRFDKAAVKRLNITVSWISSGYRGLGPPRAACRILFPALALEGGALKERA
jgi:hypothetical protein